MCQFDVHQYNQPLALLTAERVTFWQVQNGMVHVVDTVLLPPSTQRTVVSIATGGASQFSTLIELLTAADLVITLSADGINDAFTVFAPTNAAFAQVDAKTIESLKKPENKV
jgi:uncharacterized surface protein with fasciclin (FAS1) repeats